MGVNITKPTVVYVDKSGAIQLSKDLKSCTRSRHIERRYLWVRELVHRGEVVVRYCPTSENVADALTKPLPAPAVRRFHDAMAGTAPLPLPDLAGPPGRIGLSVLRPDKFSDLRMV